MHSRYFKLARSVSLQSPSRFKLGCVIVNKNRVISVGHNHMSKTNPNYKTYGNFIHAELDALNNTSFNDTNNGVAYVYRETLNGDLAKARPCEVCLKELKKRGIREICYTIENNYSKEYIK